MNVYAYVGNDPVNLIDPEGLTALGDFFDGAASLGIDAGYALGHLGARLGFLGTDAQAYAFRLDNLVAAGLLAGMYNPPEDPLGVALDAALRNKAFLGGRVSGGLIVTAKLGPGVAAALAGTAGYGSLLRQANRGSEHLSVLEGLYGFDFEDVCDAAR